MDLKLVLKLNHLNQLRGRKESELATGLYFMGPLLTWHFVLGLPRLGVNLQSHHS